AVDELWLSLYAVQEFGSPTFPELTSTIQYKLFFLFPLAVQAVQSVLGISLWAARFPALLCALGSLVALWQVARLMNWSSASRYLLYLGFIFSNSSIVMFHWARPEGM